MQQIMRQNLSLVRHCDRAFVIQCKKLLILRCNGVCAQIWNISILFLDQHKHVMEKQVLLQKFTITFVGGMTVFTPTGMMCENSEFLSKPKNKNYLVVIHSNFQVVV